ncbi:MAG: hypothetical protein M1817_002786 [Caeruleum heppii]|nr:MAG: hypothetical protein M1817_002786 [Caeruleum heppii]
MQPALAPAPHAMQAPGPDSAVEQSLRAHLLAQAGQQAQPVTPQNNENVRPGDSASPHDQNIDPAISGSGIAASPSNDSGGEESMVDASGKKIGKRELSTSKRAAQNRAAQRAFRQRKEGYIKKLEEQVRDLHALEENYKAIQAENYQLRDYIINLQSRLIESQTEFPQPPSNIVLAQPRQDLGPPPPPQQQQQSGQAQPSQGGQQPQQQINVAPTAPMAPSAMDQLQAHAAQASAVAGLEGMGKHRHDEAAFLVGNGYPPAKRMKGGENEASSTSEAKGEPNGAGITS